MFYRLKISDRRKEQLLRFVEIDKAISILLEQN